MKRIGIFVTCTLLSACASRLQVADISDAEPGSEIGGVPFKLPEAYRIAVFQRLTNGDGEVVYKEVYDDRMVLASRTRTYAARFDADFLSDHSLTMVINPDGTLTTSNLTSDPQLDEALAALGEEYKSFKDARRAVDDAETAAQTATQTAEDQALVAALQASLEVEAAEVALASLPDKATATEIQAARARLQLAQLQANLAYKAIGRPQPYPEVTP